MVRKAHITSFQKMDPSSEPFLVVYTIYENPTDYPGKFVVRKHDVIAGSSTPAELPCAIASSLDEARKTIPDGMVNIQRLPEDEPQIVESWI